MALSVFSIVSIFYVFDLYNTQYRFTTIYYFTRLSLAVTLAGIMMIAFLYLGRYPFPRCLFALNILLNILFLSIWRFFYYLLFVDYRVYRKVVIIGAGRAGKSIYDLITKSHHHNYLIVGFLDDNPDNLYSKVGNSRVIGSSRMLTKLAQEGSIDAVVLAITEEKNPHLLKLLLSLKAMGVHVYDMVSFFEEVAGKLPLEYINDGWMALTPFQGMHAGIYTSRFKRLLDIIMSAIGIIVFMPLSVLIAAAIKLNSKGPVLFKQRRIGLNGRPFVIYKFRTMKTGSEHDRSMAGKKNDPRITRVGRVLRFFRLDEIPQIVNVFKGDMSFVGPRALMEQEVKKFEEIIPYFSLRHCVRPGITGWAQVNFRHCVDLDGSMERLKYDLFYVKNLSFVLDLYIILKTVRVMLIGKGAK